MQDLTISVAQRFTLITLLACLATLSPVRAADLSDNQIKRSISRFIQQYIDANRVHAVSIGVVRNGRRWTAHFGQLSQHQPTRPNDNTMYEIGSLSKLMTATLLADAVGRKRLGLNTIVSSLVPMPAGPAQSMQLLDLATHRSGLPRMPANFRPANRLNPYLDYSRDKLFAFLRDYRPKQAAPTNYRYSNLGVGLLGELLAINAGTDYETLFKNTITKPLRMTHSRVRLFANDTLAPAHNEGLEPTESWEFNGLTGAGGIRSTVADMNRFMQAVLKPPASPLGRAIELTWRQHTPVGQKKKMGLGWFINRRGQRNHSGRTGGYRASIQVDRQLKTGAVVLINSPTGEAAAISQALFRLFQGKRLQKIKPVYKVKVSDRTKLRLTGRYRINSSSVLEVRMNQGWLVGQVTGSRGRRLYPQSDTRWEATRVKAKMAFDLPATGPARSVVIEQGKQQITALRLK